MNQDQEHDQLAQYGVPIIELRPERVSEDYIAIGRLVGQEENGKLELWGDNCVTPYVYCCSLKGWRRAALVSVNPKNNFDDLPALGVLLTGAGDADVGLMMITNIIKTCQEYESGFKDISVSKGTLDCVQVPTGQDSYCNAYHFVFSCDFHDKKLFHHAYFVLPELKLGDCLIAYSDLRDMAWKRGFRDSIGKSIGYLDMHASSHRTIDNISADGLDNIQIKTAPEVLYPKTVELLYSVKEYLASNAVIDILDCPQIAASFVAWLEEKKVNQIPLWENDPNLELYWKIWSSLGIGLPQIQRQHLVDMVRRSE